MKHLGEYLDFYVQSKTFWLANVFENFRNMSIKINQLAPSKFILAPGVAWKIV